MNDHLTTAAKRHDEITVADLKLDLVGLGEVLAPFDGAAAEPVNARSPSASETRVTAINRMYPSDGRLRVRGVGRSADDQRALFVHFANIPTDDELRRMSDVLHAEFNELQGGVAAPVAAAAPWCVHVYGPDDLLPMPSREAALNEANALNSALLLRRHNDGNDPLCVAVVEPWPYSAEGHAKEVADASQEGAQ